MKLAIDLGGTNVRIGIIKEGTVIDKIVRPCPSTLSYMEGVAYLVSLIETMISPEVKSIGIGVPSVVDATRGIVYNVVNIPSWKEVPLKDILEEKFHIPVFVNNDANCFALGEYTFGEGKPYKDMLGITIGTGVGAGVIIDGQLFNGKNTGAGEIGSLPYLANDFEHYCSSIFFTRYHKITAKEAGKRAKAGDEKTLGIWNEFGMHFGNLIKAAMFTYDPEAIVLGGGITEAYPFFEKSMKETIQSFPYVESVKNLRILVSVKENISLLGASALTK